MLPLKNLANGPIGKYDMENKLSVHQGPSLDPARPVIVIINAIFHALGTRGT